MLSLSSDLDLKWESQTQTPRIPIVFEKQEENDSFSASDNINECNIGAFIPLFYIKKDWDAEIAIS